MKLVKSKDSDLPKLNKALNNLSNNYTLVGHFDEQGTHSDSDLTYPALLFIWYMGLAYGNEGVKRQPREAFIWKEFEQAGIMKDTTMKKYIEEYLSKLLTTGADNILMEKAGRHLADKYKDIFGVVGPMMPPDKNGTPMLETHELAMNVAYKTKSNKSYRK